MTSDVARTTLLALLAGVLLTADVHGQRPDQGDQYLALRGLAAAKAHVMVQWDMGITMRGGTTRSDFERDVRREFELGLAGTGVRLDETAASRVDCVVSLTHVENATGTVVLSRTVRLFSPDDSEDPLGRWTIRWSQGESRVRDRDSLSGSEVGRDCATVFERDWRRANPESRTGVVVGRQSP